MQGGVFGVRRSFRARHADPQFVLDFSGNETDKGLQSLARIVHEADIGSGTFRRADQDLASEDAQSLEFAAQYNIGVIGNEDGIGEHFKGGGVELQGFRGRFGQIDLIANFHHVAERR